MFKIQKLLWLGMLILPLAVVSCEKMANDEEAIEPGIENDVIKTRLALSETEMKNIAPSNDFAFRFFQKSFEDGTDMLLSPLGFQMTMAMIGNAVEDEKAVCEKLGFEGAGLDEMNTYFEHLIGSLSGDSFNKELKLANALMADVRAAKYPGFFLDVLKSSYAADYNEIVAESLQAQPMGNRPEDIWCQQKTDGLIKKAPFPIEEFQSSLLNVFLFKGEWQDKFDKDLTDTRFFYSGPDKAAYASFMNKQDKVNFYGCDNFRAVSLPFGDGTFNLSIILPDLNDSVSGVLQKLDSKTWNDTRNGFKKKEVRLSIPTFSTSYSTRMLMDFSFKKGVPSLNLIGQEAMFLMNEEGASAAAVTQARAPISPGPSGTQGIEAFVADRPFIYTISEAGSGLILFVGVYSGADKEPIEF